jgi:Peptidase family M28
MFRRLTHSFIACATAALCLLCYRPTTNAQGIRYGRVSRDIVETRLRQYGGDNTHREATLKQLFAQAGCDDKHVSEQPIRDLKQPNIICMLPGSSGRTIIVGAHFDRVMHGDGVVDNWSGASLLPSLFQAIKDQPRTHNYIFVGFAGEESGEIGSRFYVQNMTKGEVAATDAMVNMDTLGLGPTKVWGSHSDKLLTGALGYIAKQINAPVAIVDVEQVGSSDSEQFASREIPRITIHSLTQKTWEARVLHTTNDKISAINLDDYYQTYILVAAYLAFLDQVPDRSAPAQKP